MDKIPKVSIVENLYNKNKFHMGKTAIEYMERKITYDELFRNISIVADSLKKIGIKKGDIVTVMPLNTPEFLYTYYALNMIGAVANSIHPLCSKRDIKNYLNEVNQKFIICSDVNCKVLNDALCEYNSQEKKVIGIIAPISNSTPIGTQIKNIKNKELVKKSKELKNNVKNAIKSSNFIMWNDFIKNSTGLKSKEKNKIFKFEGLYEDVALIVHTGGTTGVPKGVILTNKNGVALTQYHAETKELASLLNEKTKILGNISMYTAFGFLDNLNVPLTLGINVELEPIYSVDTFIKDVCKKKPNIIFTVPSFLEEFKSEIEKQEINSNKKVDLSFIDAIIIGGQKLPSKITDELDLFFEKRQPKKELKVKINTGYGSSETSAAATCTIFDGCDRKKVGKPFSYVKLKIVDSETKKELPIGEVGEIIISGPTVMQGYYNMEDETKKVLYVDDHNNVNYCTGDIGFIDKNGELDVIGRIRKMITMYNGYKIASPSIEDMIESLDIIKDCVIVPMKDPNHAKGEVPKAYVSLMGNYDKDLVIKKVKDIVANNMNERNKIYDVIIVDNIPITKLGKKDFKAIEILDLINSMSEEIKCAIYNSSTTNFDYMCEIENYSQFSDEYVLNKIMKLVSEKEEKEGIKVEKRKNIKYEFTKFRYLDKDCKEKCKVLNK